MTENKKRGPDLKSGNRLQKEHTDSNIAKFIVIIFIASLLIPTFFFVGSMRLSPYRIIIFLTIFPTLFMLAFGKLGKLVLADGFVFLICIWSTLSISVLHGFMIMKETIGVFWIETLGAYLIGRAFVQTPVIFNLVVKALVSASIIFLPLAIYESISGRSIINEILSIIAPTYPVGGMEPRWGLQRVQGPFPHPIHFGVFFLSTVGLTYYTFGYGKSKIVQLWATSQTAILGSLSLSSGPVVSLTIQLIMIAWDSIFRRVKNHWWKFIVLSVTVFFAIDIISNRTPFHVVIEYLSFNKETAYNRLRIWEFGVESIFTNPLFGIGFGYWERPWWMSDSVDMFWILGGIRHGIPVWVAWIALYFSVFIPIALRKNISDRLNSQRKGYLVAMVGLFFSGWTVHFWDVSYVYLMFLFGAGSWFTSYIEDNNDKLIFNQMQEKNERRLYSRFKPIRKLDQIHS